MDLTKCVALSIRQPWASLIIHGGKDVENRDWYSNYRGVVLIHASKKISVDEFESWMSLRQNLAIWKSALVRKLFLDLKFGDLPRGGIIGAVEMTDCVKEYPSPWSTGGWQFVLKNPVPCPFIRCRGMPGFFSPSHPVFAGKPD